MSVEAKMPDTPFQGVSSSNPNLHGNRLAELHRDGKQEELGKTFSDLMNDSRIHESASSQNILAPAHEPENSTEHSELHPETNSPAIVVNAFKKLNSFLRPLKAKITQDMAYYNYGNYVIINRETGEKRFEQMPLYTRVGMHVLFCGSLNEALLNDGYAAKLFLRETIAMGKNFNEPGSTAKIAGFVKSFNLPLDDLAEPDLSKYACFNDFFARKLRSNARAIAEPDNERIMVASADSRCVAFEDIATAQKVWIKGRHFSIANLIQDTATSGHYEGGSIAIFRLAPQDYHRWHSPMDARCGEAKKIKGTYFTVNPMAVNEDLDVFTENHRSVMPLYTQNSTTPVLCIAVGALLVGSIEWTVETDQNIKKGDELGAFKYGGSTVIYVIPANIHVKFDADLLSSSLNGVETLVKVGERIGKCLSPAIN